MELTAEAFSKKFVRECRIDTARIGRMRHIVVTHQPSGLTATADVGRETESRTKATLIRRLAIQYLDSIHGSYA